MSTWDCIKAHFYNPSNFMKLEVLQKSTILWEIKVLRNKSVLGGQ